MRFEAVVLPHLDAAYRFAIGLTRSRADAQDLVQEATLRAYRGIEKLRGADAKAWLFTIVRNCFFTLRAKENRWSSAPGSDGDQDVAETLIEPSAGPEAASLQESERHAVGQSLSKLSTEHREVLVLKEIEELSYREIAAVIGVPIGTVMSRLSRARAALRDQWLADHGERGV